MEKIDELDKKILNIIRENARMPIQEVADACKVSRPAVHQRMQRMQEVGIITGSSYEINPKALGYNISTYIGIKLEKGSLYKQVVPQLKEIPEIIECHFTLGPYTILIKLYAKNDEHLMELLNKKIQEIDGVTSTETLMSLEQSIKRDLEIK